METGFLTEDELAALGLASCGRGVRIDRSVRIIAPAQIHVGNCSRIDAFALLSAAGGEIRIGRHAHIAAGAYLFGGGGIEVGDYVGISARSILYSTNDDYSGEAMTNPTLPAEFTNVSAAPVRIGSHAVIGAGSILLPGVTLGEGAVIGAMSFVRADVPPFAIMAGVPARYIKDRSRVLLNLAGDYESRV